MYQSVLTLIAACLWSCSVYAQIVQEGVVSDEQITQSLDKVFEQLSKKGKAVTIADLQPQLKRKTCRLTLSEAQDTSLMTPAELYEQSLASIVMVASRYKCGHCDEWHNNVASGYIISESGACVTNYHVVETPSDEPRWQSPLVVMNGKGEAYEVKEVLAADKAADVAILQLKGKGFKPLALKAKAPVGSAVYVIAHPMDHYFYLTEGIISRYASEKDKGKVMSITADYAAGSSGGAILNAYGQVVGMVRETFSGYYTIKPDGTQKDLQMVFKYSVPAELILKAIQPPKTAARKTMKK